MEEQKQTFIEDGQLVSEVTGTWEAVTKNAEGEAEIHTLHKHSVKRRPLEEGVDNLEDMLVSRAAPTLITPTTRRRPRRGEKLAVAFGDAQIGYRNGEPFHDERALNMAAYAVHELQPDTVAMTGDMIDLPAMSRFEQRADWQLSTQRSLDRYHAFLAQLRANAPNANIVVVHGNHELRMDRYVRNNTAELLGIRRANTESKLGILTLQYLARYDDLDVVSYDGYPNAAFWLEDDLKVTHGTNVAKGGSNAAKYLQQEATSTIFGHTHRLEVAHRTIPTRRGAITITAASPGALCRTDGAVPGFRFSTDETGAVVHRSEDWQQGLLVVNHDASGHEITPVRLTEKGILLNGKRHAA